MSVPPGPTHDELDAVRRSGGVLLRFAGTRLAAGDDDLTPTALRRGGRTLGGALSWETPKHIAAVRSGQPVLRPRRAGRGDGLAPGARRAGAGPRRQDLGAARRRHAAGHRRAARQGADRALPRHRRHDLVEPAAVRACSSTCCAGSSREAGAAPAERPLTKAAVGQQATRAALAHARRLRRARRAARRRRADRRRFRRRRRRRASARLLRPADALSAVNALAPGATLAPADYGALAVAAPAASTSPPPLDLQAVAAARRACSAFSSTRCRQPVARPRGSACAGQALAALMLAAALGALPLPGAPRAARSRGEPARHRRGAADPSRLCRDRRRRRSTRRPASASRRWRGCSAARTSADRRAGRGRSGPRRTRASIR